LPEATLPGFILSFERNLPDVLRDPAGKLGNSLLGVPFRKTARLLLQKRDVAKALSQTDKHELIRQHIKACAGGKIHLREVL
jgi:hypothetical protein